MAAKVYCKKCGYERSPSSASKCRHCYQADAAESDANLQARFEIGKLIEAAYQRGFRDGSKRVRNVVYAQAIDALQVREGGANAKGASQTGTN